MHARNELLRAVGQRTSTIQEMVACECVDSITDFANDVPFNERSLVPMQF